MKKLIAIFVLTILLSGHYILDTRADLVLYPGDDAYVDVFTPTTPRPANGLRTDYSNTPTCSNTRYSYLRFDLSQLTIDVGPDTKVRIYQTTGPTTSATLGLWSTGDDWNGAADGLGDESTLIWDNRPASIALLDSKPSGTTAAWIEFAGSGLSSYLNQQRLANGGDNIASFLIQWDTAACPTLGDSNRFEDAENTRGSGNLPQIYPFGPTAITLSAFSASSHISSPWWLLLGVGLLVLVAAAALVLIRRSKMAA